MTGTNIYLTFDGNCREAMTFYAQSLRADLQISRFGDAPIDAPADAQDRTIHARLTRNGAILLMASDTMPGMPIQQGTNFSVAVTCDSAEEVSQLYAAFADGGAPIMAPQQMFWGAFFGMTRDRFGISWMFSFDLPQAG